MKKSVFVLFLITSAALTAQSTWKADRAHSKIGFSITHLMISEVEGQFGEFDITATANDSFSDPKFTVDIKSASIDTDTERRDNDLRSDHFFDVANYPSISFKSTSIEKTGDKTFKLTGDLTMHGVTKPVSLDGKLIGIITDQRSQKLKAGLKLTGVLNRKDFGVGASSMAPVGDDVTLNINLEMAQQ
jgi:polyisoprenoid-binding protein YceI